MAQKNALVSQHLENISRDALKKYQGLIRRYVRRRQGVYSLYRRDKLYYVGLASNLRSRLNQHLQDKHGLSWDRFSVYLTIGDNHLKEIESLILRMSKPKGNKQSGKFAISEDLRKKFSKDIRVAQKEEFTSLIGRRFAGMFGSEESSDKGNGFILSKYIERSLKLRANFKGKLIKALVKRNGSVRFSGKIYKSPSLAGAAACKRSTCNGWTFWKYERGPGNWVSLDELRK